MRWLAWTTAAVMVAACTAGGSNDKGAGGAGADGSGAGDGIGGNFSASGGSDTGGGCNDLTVEFEAQTPTVILLIDRSGSMFDQAYGSSPDRWSPLYDVLMDATNGVVAALQSTVRFGFAAYTNDPGQAACPILDEVAPTLDNYSAIDQIYSSLGTKPPFKAETPTGVSVSAVAASLAAFTEPGPKYIVLATDGEPDTCAHPDPQCGQDESIVAVQAAFDEGIRTFVIGIGNEVGGKHLSDLANAGAGLAVEEPDASFLNTCVNSGIASMAAEYATVGGDAEYYQPADQAALQDNLSAIIEGVRECGYELKESVKLDKAAECEVLIDGVPVEHATGWTLVDEETLELLPGACHQLQMAQQIDISCPCEAIIK